MTPIEAANAVADPVLAGIVFTVAFLAMRGWRHEAKAKRLSGRNRQVAEEDAKTFYALAAVQRPVIFLSALAGSALKLIAPIVVFIAALGHLGAGR